MTTPQSAAPGAQVLADVPEVRPERSITNRFRRNPLAMVGLIGTSFFAVLGVIGVAIQLLPGMDDLYAGQDLMNSFVPIFGEGYPAGTDNLGRDMLWRLIAGIGTSLLVGVAVTALSLAVGLGLGVIAGYEGRFAAPVIGGLIDVALAFPVLLLAVVLAGAVGPGLVPVIIAVALTNWAGLARIVRTEVKSLRQREFMDAARSLGHPTPRIVMRHVVPNLIPTLLVMTAYFMAIAVVVEAGFSFLALGAQPPTPSLGGMIADGRNFLSISTWPAMAAGITLALVVLSLNTLGDGLRDVLDSAGRRMTGPDDARASEAAATAERPILEIDDLTTVIRAGDRELVAVESFSLDVAPGRIVGIVGESGSGKTLTALSIMRLLGKNVSVRSGSIRLDGQDLLRLPMNEMRALRGRRVSMVFQEPMTSLDPSFTVGSLLTEAARAHGMSKSEASELAEHMLERVGIAEPGRRMHDYPHQFSGGMRQRVMIALALQLRPAVLVADEPTTALDVTLQAQILDLIAGLTQEMHLAVVLITHDLGVVHEVADEVAVMYAGRLVERGPVEQVFEGPAHPYTEGLLASVRSRADRFTPLHVIPGRVPDPSESVGACTFAARCEYADETCRASEPALEADAGSGGRAWRCFHPLGRS